MPYCCIVDCLHEAPDRSSLAVHIRSEHGKFMCLYGDCLTVCKTLKFLNVHVDNIHLGRKFVCAGCGKKYASRGSLSTHRKTSCKGVVLDSAMVSSSIVDEVSDPVPDVGVSVVADVAFSGEMGVASSVDVGETLVPIKRDAWTQTEGECVCVFLLCVPFVILVCFRMFA